MSERMGQSFGYTESGNTGKLEQVKHLGRDIADLRVQLEAAANRVEGSQSLLKLFPPANENDAETNSKLVA
jgi:hypothetical protein